MNVGSASAREHEPLLTLHETDQPITLRAQKPAKRCEFLPCTQTDWHVKSGDVGLSLVELTQGMEATHDRDLERKAGFDRERFAQRRKREVVTRRNPQRHRLHVLCLRRTLFAARPRSDI